MTLTLIVAPDIYGLTPAMDELAGQLAADRVILLDPYTPGGEYFTNQKTAYAHFTRQVGIAGYARTIYNLLMDRPPDRDEDNRVLLGFSVGASALWTLADNHELSGIRLCLGYYGSQIRNHTGVSPLWPVELIFPEREDHFEVSTLMGRLREKPHLTLRQVRAGHGFMNPHSLNYDAALARAQIRYINHRLDQVRQSL